MSCYVDAAIYYPKKGTQAARYGNRPWAHLWDETLDELHAMADKLGLKRAWFQDRPGFPHYDVMATVRAKAVKAGAAEASRADLVAYVRRNRAAPSEQGKV